MRVIVDGELFEFERVTVGDHWLAIGVIDNAEVAVEGHSFDPQQLELTRLNRGRGPATA